MSCVNGNSPIDISMSNVKGNCNLKCEYSFKYSNTPSSIAKNQGDYLSLTYDNNSGNVKYNKYDYNVEEIRFYSPSLHSFNGSKTDGEIIIIHNSVMGYPQLLVCIPVKNTNSNTSASQILSQIVDTVSKTAPSEGETTTLQIENFNLNEFVPNKKSFFSYTANLPFQPCNGNVYFIVYNNLVEYIDIMNNTFTTLTNLIKKNVYDVKTGPDLFFNPKGANTTNLTSNTIYIDCQPTDSSEEQTQVVVKQTTPITLQSILNSEYFQMFLGCILFLIIIMIFYFSISSLNKYKE
jgi:carbonic anhydrase